LVRDVGGCFLSVNEQSEWTDLVEHHPSSEINLLLFSDSDPSSLIRMHHITDKEVVCVHADRVKQFKKKYVLGKVFSYTLPVQRRRLGSANVRDRSLSTAQPPLHRDEGAILIFLSGATTPTKRKLFCYALSNSVEPVHGLPFTLMKPEDNLMMGVPYSQHHLMHMDNGKVRCTLTFKDTGGMLNHIQKQKVDICNTT